MILFNIWDAGGAKAVADAGAKAIATGSHSVAVANGYDDGEQVPFDFAVANFERIVANVDLPVTLDFEGGCAVEAVGLKLNIAKVIAVGSATAGTLSTDDGATDLVGPHRFFVIFVFFVGRSPTPVITFCFTDEKVRSQTRSEFGARAVDAVPV